MKERSDQQEISRTVVVVPFADERAHREHHKGLERGDP